MTVISFKGVDKGLRRQKGILYQCLYGEKLDTTAFIFIQSWVSHFGPTLALAQLYQCYQWVLTLPEGLKTLNKQHQKCSQGIFWERLTIMRGEM